MEIAALTFTFPVAALAAALIGRVESLWVTVVGGVRDRTRAVEPRMR